MAEITTADEQAALNSILDSQAKAEYWIGLTDTSVTGKWIWQHSNSTVTNETNKWTNWDDGQPDNWGNCERCAEIRNSAGKWVWNYVNCGGENNGSCYPTKMLPLCQILGD